MCPPYPQRDRKRRLNGAVCRNHRIKRVVPRWEPDRRSNFFSPPAHLCAVTYMTEISLIVTLNNQFTYLFHITNFPFLSSKFPSLPAYGVFISQLIQCARACSSNECFILRAMRLSNKLLGQGYVKERLQSSLRKFYGRYGDLTKQYEVRLFRMLHDILDDDHIQWHPPWDVTPIFDHYWSGPYYRIWLFI